MTSDKQKQYYTYIILCEDGSYYTGYSNDPHRRFEQHKSGNGAKYTRSHKPKELVLVSPALTKSEALKKEYEIKQMTHQQKKDFIAWWNKQLNRGKAGRALAIVLGMN